ncbi:hypothetical protein CYMTET_43848 [Cymbomonas tetramitiformis]|uniref:Phospholipase/carboxylesterase/thioesterase domain-containing protein n=1 Tax=Cymbomonas tetramitiformis TaxID=36881 RepID=A0AAE0EZK5_9CHLO|nr:hypothetical protein CYMTET_43848 [Cymbomonas tetramitiformis]
MRHFAPILWLIIYEWFYSLGALCYNGPEYLIVGNLKGVSVYYPDSHDSDVDTPVVIALHGYKMTGVQIVGPAPCHGGPDAPDGEGTSHTGLDLLGVMDELGFVLVAPTGRRDCWNHTYFASAYPYSTACCACPQQGTECRRRCGFDMDGVRNGEDTDAQDVAGIIQHLKVQMAVDASRTYAIGFSVGAVLAHRLACEHSSIFAAVIAISGGLQTAHCAPSEPVSILQMHGTADPVVDYDITVAKTLAAWSANNGCSKPEGPLRFSHTQYRSTVPCHDTPIIYADEWKADNCPRHGEVVHWRFLGGEHKMRYDDVATGMVEFLFSHSKTSSTDDGNKNALDRTWIMVGTISLCLAAMGSAFYSCKRHTVESKNTPKEIVYRFDDIFE